MNTPQAKQSLSTDQQIRAIAEACRNAAASPFLPGPVREALPRLGEVLAQQHGAIKALAAQVQELREQHRPPCEGCTKAAPIGADGYPIPAVA